MKVVSKNKRAKFDYEIVDTLVAGIQLFGSEVKSIKLGDVDITSSFIKIENMEAFIYGMKISKYKFQNIGNHDPQRTKKILLNKKEIRKINDKIILERKVVIPLKILINSRGLIKIEIGIGKPRNKHDKREYEKEKESKKIIKNYY